MDYMQTFRLIKNFIPKTYSIALDIRRDERYFEGLTTITGEVPASSDSIKLNSTDLDIKAVNLDGHSVKFKLENDILTISTNPGKHILTVEYSAKITDSMRGMYPCYYRDNDEKKELIATQFESCSAREVFPCVDEPEAKATFDLSLTTEVGVTVLSNMPYKFQREENGRLVTVFQTTPVMSSYLLAWAYGDLHSKSTKTKHGTDISVWATKAQAPEKLDFALDIAKRSIEFYEDYFGVPYPLPKSDQIALPDFAAGAMENWGLVTYREHALLCDPKLTPIDERRYIATVIAHELSHQWFGDLVTMRWWNDLWLNESFASMMEYRAVDALEPKWNIWSEFNESEVNFALQRDSLDGVQPVRIDVDNPSEIDSIFDGAIVYAKGSRLIKTLLNYVGEDNFRAGLHNYFQKHTYNNTEAIDLWDELSKVSNKKIDEFMNPWLNQPGFPVLTVTRNAQTLKLRQDRLVNRASRPSNSIWPILLGTNLSEAPEIMDKREIELTIPDEFTDAVRFNIGNNAHFITRYDDFSLNQILADLEAGKLSDIDRLQLLNEQCMLVEAGLTDGAKLIDILQAYKNESSEAVWALISRTIRLLRKLTHGDKLAQANLRKFVNALAKPQFDRVGWDQKPDEKPNDTRLRSLIIGLMLYSRDDKVVHEALRRFDSSTIEHLDPELRGILVNTAVHHRETESLIDHLIDLYQTTSSSDIKLDVCRALTQTKKTATVDRILQIMMDKNIVKPQDLAHFFAFMIRNPYARKQVWQWMQQKWSWLYDQFKGDNTYDNYPRYAAGGLIEHGELEEYKKFFEPMINDPMLARTIELGINEITNRILIIEHNRTSVATRLTQI